MSSKTPRNVAASVHRKLYNLGKKQGGNFQLLSIRYATERLLYRMSVSPHAHKFILKGALLFVTWSDNTYRSTRDVDLLALGETDAESMRNIIESVATQPVEEEDGIFFDTKSIRMDEIREMDIYQGLRIRLKAFLGKMVIPVQMDLGFGDVVIPEPDFITYPALLNFPAPRIKAYPPETVIAEKVQTIVALGMANSRMKDYYDLFVIFQQFPIDRENLSRAIQATFERRETAIPRQIPVGLSFEFAADSDKQNQWSQFLRRYDFQDPAGSLSAVIRLLQEKIVPIWEGIRDGYEV